jgi:hypothetical protein
MKNYWSKYIPGKYFFARINKKINGVFRYTWPICGIPAHFIEHGGKITAICVNHFLFTIESKINKPITFLPAEEYPVEMAHFIIEPLKKKFAEDGGVGGQNR